MDGSERCPIQKKPQKTGPSLGGGVSVANFSREFPRFFFERTGGEPRAICAVTEIVTAPLFQSATALALGDVHEIMHNQFAIVPGVGPNDQSVPETHAPGVIGDNADSLRCFSEIWIFGQRNSIDQQHSDPSGLDNAGHNGIGQVAGTQRIAVFQDELLLLLCPLHRNRKQFFECF